MQPVALPPPYAGIDEQVPKVALQSPFCENSLNFNYTQNGAELRNGDSLLAILGNANQYSQYRLFSYADTKLLNMTYNHSTSKMDLWDVEAGTVGYSSAASGQPATVGFQPLYFNNYLFFFTTTTYAPGIYYNGSAYGSIGYTGSGTFTPFGGAVFNNRAYLIQYGEPAYWYTPLYAISGAISKVDLSTIISQKANLAIIARVTVTNQAGAQELVVFIFFSGEVLFYSGSYPDSQSWTLAGKAQIGPPLNYGSGVQYQGDYLVWCDTGVVSLRDLFLEGSEKASSLTINSRIQKTWESCVLANRTAYSVPVGPVQGVRGVWDKTNSRIIISFSRPPSTTANEGNWFFIFNTKTQSWYFHKSFGAGVDIFDIATYKGSVYFPAELATKMAIYKKEGASGFADRNSTDSGDTGFTFELKSAPLPAGRTQVAKCKGMDVLIETDLETVTNYYLIRDLGLETTTAQLLPDIPTGVQKPFLNIGIEGSYIQYKISGTTVTGKTVGLKLYGVNMWIEQGGAPR